jgi:membrane-associated phospholipid phosphatase
LTGKKDDTTPMTMGEVISRARANLVLKVGLSVGLTLLFAVCYVLPQRVPVFPATAMRETWLDRAIPFEPGAIYVYESLLLLMPIAPWMMRSADRLKRYSLGLAAMDLIGAAFFVLLPTSVPRPQVSHDAHTLYGLVVALDANLNAFPSLHAAYALFHGAWCQGMFCTGKGRASRVFFWCWAWGIVVSTLLVKQHVVIDCVGGVVLGLGGYAACRRFPRGGRSTGRTGMAED